MMSPPRRPRPAGSAIRPDPRPPSPTQNTPHPMKSRDRRTQPISRPVSQLRFPFLSPVSNVVSPLSKMGKGKPFSLLPLRLFSRAAHCPSRLSAVVGVFFSRAMDLRQIAASLQKNREIDLHLGPSRPPRAVPLFCHQHAPTW